MTPEERQAKLDQLDRLQKLKRLKELQAKKASLEAGENMSATDTARGALQAFNRGSAFGFGDEIVGAGRAAIDYVTNPGDQSFADRYAMYRDDERANMERFNEANPGTSLALTLAGGITSPLNRVAPGFGVGKGTTLAQGVGRASTEGAIAGFGEGEGDANQQLMSTITGGALGGAFNAGMRGAGKALQNTIFRRNVAPNLDQPDGSFMPIYLAEPDTNLGKLYRGTGRIFGANTKFAEQERPFVEKAARKLEDLQEQARHRSTQIDMDKEAAKLRVDTKAAQQAEKLNTRLGLAQTRNKARAAQKATQTAIQFQDTAARRALPAHAQDVLEGVDTRDAEATADAIRTWWTKNGFDEVKQFTFDFDPELGRKIQSRIDEDPALRLAFGDMMPKLQGMIENLKGAYSPGKELAPSDLIEALTGDQKMLINGDALMAMRNIFATGANGTSKNSGALRQIANKFDDLIRRQLPEEAVEQYDDQIRRYSTALAFSDAARRDKVWAEGVIDPVEWRRAAKKYGGGTSSMSTKKPPLDAEAKAARQVVKDAEKKAAARETRLKKAKANTANKLSEETALAKSLANKRARLEREMMWRDEKLPGGALHDAKQEADMLSRNTTPQNASFLSQLLTTGTVGGMAPGVGARHRAGRIAAGMVIGNRLAEPSTQRFFAGQTKVQNAARAALMRGDLDEYYRIISRMAAQGSVGAAQ